MAIKKVLLTKKLNDIIYDIFPKTTAEVVAYGETTVAAELARFAADMANYYTTTQADTKIKESCDNLYNKIMGLTDSDTTIDQAYDTLKEVAAWINEHGEVAAAFTTDIAALKQAVGDENSGLVKALADANTAISTNSGNITTLQQAIAALQTAVGDINSGLTKTVNDHTTKIGALETVVGDSTSGLVKKVNDLEAVGATKVEKSDTNGNVKIDGQEVNVYTHPESHPATMITEDDTHKFVTADEKSIINNAAAVVFVTSQDAVANERDLYMVEIA